MNGERGFEVGIGRASKSRGCDYILREGFEVDRAQQERRVKGKGKGKEKEDCKTPRQDIDDLEERKDGI